MADYAASNTKRIKVLQTGPRGSHHMVFRFPEVQDEATMISQTRAATLAMNNICMDGASWVSAEVAHEGSEVFLPVDWGAPQVAASGAGVVATDEYGYYVNFVGRSLGGSRVAFYLFNVFGGVKTANNRLTTAENASLAGILATLAGAGINFVAIDQNPFVMKGYANTGINDAVAKKSRSLA
jgi:hypothetical protein